MVAHALDHRRGAGVADTEPLTGHAPDKGFAGGCAVQGHVADDDIFLGLEFALFRRVDDELAAGKALAEIVVGVALQLQRQALGDKCAEALTRAAGAANLVGILGQTVAVAAGDLRTEQGAEGPVSAGDIQRQAGGLSGQQGAGQLLEKNFLVQGPLQMEVVHIPRFKTGALFSGIGVFQNAGQVHRFRPMADGVLHGL